MNESPLPFRRLLTGAAAFAGLSLAARFLLPPGLGRYGLYLIVFTIWMAWFVRTVAVSLGDPGL